MVGVLFPSKFEAEGFLEELTGKKETSYGDLWTCSGQLEHHPVTVGVIGIGPQPSARRTTEFLKKVPAQSVVLGGFAGSLTPRLSKGDTIIAAEVSSDELINFMKLLPNFSIAKVYTADQVVAGREARLHLAQQTGCQVVDMETAPVAELVRDAGLEFMCVRAISDGLDDEVPTAILSKTYDPATGLPYPKTRLAATFALQPWKLKALTQFVQGLHPVRDKLTTFLTSIVKEMASI
ncbi:MAG: hypothetical protein OHK005_17040 [Candidatus Methylacidiphilales bacterium]